jgi:hypothetical protein
MSCSRRSVCCCGPLEIEASRRPLSKDVSAVTDRAREVLVPLGEAEAERAVQAALDRVGPGTATELCGFELLIEKAQRRGEVPLRRVRVLIGEAASDVGYEVIVDDAGKVISADRLEGQNFPFLSEEIDRAEAIAASHERVAQLLQRPDVRAGAFHPPRHEAGHRLVGLHYMTSDPATIEMLATVVVDLATGEVVSFIGDDSGARRPREG